MSLLANPCIEQKKRQGKNHAQGQQGDAVNVVAIGQFHQNRFARKADCAE